MKLPRLSLLTQICITHLISHIHMLVLPVLMPVMLLASSDITFVQIGFAISVFNIVSAVVQAPVGIFVDRLGPKRVLMAGLIIGSLSFFSLGFINHYLWLIIAMGIIGIANAVYHPADYAILSQNVVENKMGRAFSLHTFSGMLGFAITPIIMLTVASWAGVSSAFMVSGTIGLIAAVILYPKAKNEPTKKRLSKSVTEQNTAIENDVDKKHVNQNNSNQNGMVRKNIPETVNKIPLITPAIFLMLILFFLLNMSSGSIQNFSVSALVTGYSIPLTDANIALTAFLMMTSIGVLAGGLLADYSNKHGLIAAGALVVTALFALILSIVVISSTILITIILGIMGFLSGIIAPSRDMLVRSVAPKGAEGQVFGIVSTGFNIGGAVGPILFGWILDNDYPRGIFWCAAIFMMLTAVIALCQELHSAKIKESKKR